MSRLSPPTHDHLHVPNHEPTALDYLEDNEYRRNIMKHGWDIDSKFVPAPFVPNTSEEHSYPCPWCDNKHSASFDTNECPRRKELLRQRPRRPRGPLPEPAPFIAARTEALASWSPVCRVCQGRSYTACPGCIK